MNQIYAMNSVGKCEDHLPLTRPLTPIRLTASVGPGGRNLPDDVKRVQNALNFVLPTMGGPLPKLEENGVYGESTATAITRFQLKEFRFAEFMVLPDSETINRLAKYRGGLSSGSRQKIIAALNEALNLVKGAQANLVMALPFVEAKANGGGLPSFGPDARMLYANRHFDIDKAKAPADTLRRVLRVYDTMMEVFRRPGGLWGPTVFDLDPLGLGFRAYAVPGGYFRNGQRNPLYGYIRNDSIYLCKRLERDTMETCAHIIVHELAHFVSSEQTFEEISDHKNGYGWYNDFCMQQLTPEEKVSNADNYANFAVDLRFGRPVV
ncbi:MAG: hypothetical protein ABI999_15705 [Acidobacteriota bacterium]